MHQRLKTFPLLLFGLVASASASPKPIAPSWPQSFFVGRTEGHGTLKKILSPSRKVTVRGNGRLDGVGTLILDQWIDKGDAKTKTREWRLSLEPDGRFHGTLTDALGPVTATLTANDFHVRYRMKGAVEVDQHLLLQTGGEMILNRMVFRKFGLIVAHMNESIRRVG